jgi:hypothetical protein
MRCDNGGTCGYRYELLSMNMQPGASDMRKAVSLGFALAALLAVAAPVTADAQQRPDRSLRETGQIRRQTPPARTDLGVSSQSGQGAGQICDYIRGERICPRDGLM